MFINIDLFSFVQGVHYKYNCKYDINRINVWLTKFSVLHSQYEKAKIDYSIKPAVFINLHCLQFINNE